MTDDGVYEYDYDCENRLIEVTDGGSTIAKYYYDYADRRIRKVDSKASETTLYYYNENWQVLAEYDGSGVFQKMNVYGNYIDELLYRRGTGAPTRRFYMHDHLYSLVASIMAIGVITERYEYDAYGKCTIWNGTFTTQRTEPADTGSYPNPYLFTGRRIDYLDSGNLSLMYYRNRSYDTYTGRFLQPDPIGYEDDTNLYTYVANNPIVRTDPLGLFGKCGPGKFWGIIIPDFPFAGCCEKHDHCYSGKGSGYTCATSRKKCDKDFCNCLFKKCMMFFPSCSKAGSFCSAVKLGGKKAFDRARKGTGCPEECAE